MAKVLKLNQSYEPIEIIDWKEAIRLIFLDKTEIVREYDDKFVRTSKIAFKMPVVIRLNGMFNRPRKRIKFNRKNIWARDRWRCQYCLTPDHLVLTSDLRWVPLGDLSVGDKLTAFEENSNFKHARKFCEAIVESCVLDKEEVYVVTLDDDTKFKVTADHLWLGKTIPKAKLKWFNTNNILGKYVPKLFDVWKTENSREAGWLAGIYDGEGWIIDYRNGVNTGIGQNPGIISDIIKNELISRNFNISSSIINKGRPCERILICGGISENARFLGQIRPNRLLEKFSPSLLGIVKSNNIHRVVSVELIGKMDIAKVQTTSSTLIVDGFPHHNCGKNFSSSELTLDHVIPRAQGGTTCWENIVACCSDCNDKKRNRTPAQANMKLKRHPAKSDWVPVAVMSLSRSIIPEPWRDYCFWLNDMKLDFLKFENKLIIENRGIL
ncbi:MAG: HNH endonuclease [Patescibacteria group bacterium]|jgi:5-methylcytosine-specific restriction endonuclease McrA